MPRWVQKIKEDGTSEFVPVGSGHNLPKRSAAVHGDIPAFVSPVDGSIISDRKQLREHNERNGVVCADEFSQEHYDSAAKRRADHYEGKISREEQFKRRQNIYEHWIRAERDG